MNATLASPVRDRTRSIVLRLIAIIVIAATVTAFVQSYEALSEWADRYLTDGWARTWPLQIDAWIAVGELTLYIAYRDRWPQRRRVWPWVAALSGLAASTAFNVGHLPDADLAGRLTAAVPPVAAFVGLFLGLQVLKCVEEQPPTPSHEAIDVAIERSPKGMPRRRPKLKSARDDLTLKARELLEEDPNMTGQQLGTLLKVSERTGRRLRGRVESSARRESGVSRSN